jgi:hypothetical protein
LLKKAKIGAIGTAGNSPHDCGDSYRALVRTRTGCQAKIAEVPFGLTGQKTWQALQMIDF